MNKYVMILFVITLIGCTGKKYDFQSEFDENGLALVTLNGKAGFIDKSGNEVIPLVYDAAVAFSEGFAAVELKGKNGFIDLKGNLVIPLKYEKAAFFSGGIAWVQLDGKEMYIDKYGNEYATEEEALDAVGN